VVEEASEVTEWSSRLDQVNKAYSEAQKVPALAAQLPDRSALMQAYQNYQNARKHQAVNVTGKDTSLDELLKQRRIDRLQEAETKLTEVYEELVAALGAAVSDAESTKITSPTENVDNFFVPDNLPTGPLDNGVIVQTTASETERQGTSPSSEAVAEVYKKLYSEYTKLHAEHTEMSSAYRAEVDKFYKDRAESMIKSRLDKIKGAFGLKPKLSADLMAKREELFALTAQYSAAAKRMRDVRPLKTEKTLDPAVMERYLRLLARKQVVGIFEHQLHAQKKAWDIVAKERAATRGFVGKKLHQAAEWANDPKRARTVRIIGGAVIGGTVGFATGGTVPAWMMAARAVAAGVASGAAVDNKWVQRNYISGGLAEKQKVTDNAFKEKTAALAEQLRDKALTASELQKIFAELESLYARVDEAKRAEVLRLMSVAVTVGAVVGFSSTQAMAQMLPEVLAVPNAGVGAGASAEAPAPGVGGDAQAPYEAFTPEEIAAQQAVDGETNHAATGQEMPPVAAEGGVDAPPAVESFTVRQSFPIALEDDLGRRLNEWVDLKGITLHGTADAVAKMQTEEFLSKQLPLAVKDIMAGEPRITPAQLGVALSERLQTTFPDGEVQVEIGDITPLAANEAAEAVAAGGELLLSDEVLVEVSGTNGVPAGHFEVADIKLSSPTARLDNLTPEARADLDRIVGEYVVDILRGDLEMDKHQLAQALQDQLRADLAGTDRWGPNPDLRIDVGSLTYEQYPPAAPVEPPAAPERPEPWTYTMEEGKNLWRLFQGRTTAGDLPIMDQISDAKQNQFISAVEQHLNRNPHLLREIGFGQTASEVRAGATVDLDRLHAIAEEVARQGNFIESPLESPLPSARPEGLGRMTVEELDGGERVVPITVPGAEPMTDPAAVAAPAEPRTLEAPAPSPRPAAPEVTPMGRIDSGLPPGVTTAQAERLLAQGQYLYAPEYREFVTEYKGGWPKFQAELAQAAYQLEGRSLWDENVFRDSLDAKFYGSEDSPIASPYPQLRGMSVRDFQRLDNLDLHTTVERLSPRGGPQIEYTAYVAWKDHLKEMLKLPHTPNTTMGDLFARWQIETEKARLTGLMQQNPWRP
jgi:hypothetical protein